jgi:hypothetical protein
MSNSNASERGGNASVRPDGAKRRDGHETIPSTPSGETTDGNMNRVLATKPDRSGHHDRIRPNR